MRDLSMIQNKTKPPPESIADFKVRLATILKPFKVEAPKLTVRTEEDEGYFPPSQADRKAA